MSRSRSSRRLASYSTTARPTATFAETPSRRAIRSSAACASSSSRNVMAMEASWSK
jgi:hypothetical protein